MVQIATQTLATYDAVLKNSYRGPIVELLNQETYLLDQLSAINVTEDGNQLGTFTGRQIIFPVHTGRNRGRGATTDGGTLTTAGTQSYSDAIVSPKYFDTGIELTHATILQSQTDDGAFARATSSEMDRAMTDLKKDVCRMMYGTGDGLLANCTSTQSATTIAVDSGQYIAVGDTVDVLTRSNGTVKGSSLSVTAVSFTGTASSSSQANANITLSGSVSVTAADGVYLAGDRNNESDGLRNITNTGRTLFQINSSTSPIWDGNVADAANANPSEDLFMQQAQRIRQRSGKNVDMFLTTLGIQRRLANTYASQKRYNDKQSVDIGGGYSAIMVSAGNNPVPVIADVDAPNGFVFSINKGSFAWAELARPDWLTAPEGGSQILHLKDGATAGTKVAAWQAWIFWSATLVNVAPARTGQIKNVNDDLPIARV